MDGPKRRPGLPQTTVGGNEAGHQPRELKWELKDSGQTTSSHVWQPSGPVPQQLRTHRLSAPNALPGRPLPCSVGRALPYPSALLPNPLDPMPTKRPQTRQWEGSGLRSGLHLNKKQSTLRTRRFAVRAPAHVTVHCRLPPQPLQDVERLALLARRLEEPGPARAPEVGVPQRVVGVLEPMVRAAGGGQVPAPRTVFAARSVCSLPRSHSLPLAASAAPCS